MRSRVSQTAWQAWQEPAMAHYLGRAVRSGILQPTLSIKPAELRWPDASLVSFSWPKGEPQPLQAQYSAAQRR
ncbi:MAG TPA: hypothetical protein VH373_07505 [Jatrophihabitantaceae bacterium]|jgi:hypothetical protein